jgi:hypothetical protein
MTGNQMAVYGAQSSRDILQGYPQLAAAMGNLDKSVTNYTEGLKVGAEESFQTQKGWLAQAGAIENLWSGYLGRLGEMLPEINRMRGFGPPGAGPGGTTPPDEETKKLQQTVADLEIQLATARSEIDKITISLAATTLPILTDTIRVLLPPAISAVTAGAGALNNMITWLTTNTPSWDKIKDSLTGLVTTLDDLGVNIKDANDTFKSINDAVKNNVPGGWWGVLGGWVALRLAIGTGLAGAIIKGMKNLIPTLSGSIAKGIAGAIAGLGTKFPWLGRLLGIGLGPIGLATAAAAATYGALHVGGTNKEEEADLMKDPVYKESIEKRNKVSQDILAAQEQKAAAEKNIEERRRRLAEIAGSLTVASTPEQRALAERQSANIGREISGMQEQIGKYTSSIEKLNKDLDSIPIATPTTLPGRPTTTTPVTPVSTPVMPVETPGTTKSTTSEPGVAVGAGTTVGTFIAQPKLTAEQFYQQSLQVMSDMARLLADITTGIDNLAEITDDGNSDVTRALKKYSTVAY